MTTTTTQAGYEGDYVERFQFYLQHSGEHTAMREFMDKVLPGEFARWETACNFSVVFTQAFVYISHPKIIQIVNVQVVRVNVCTCGDKPTLRK